MTDTTIEKKKITSVYIADSLLQEITRQCEADKRSRNMMIVVLIKEALEARNAGGEDGN